MSVLETAERNGAHAGLVRGKTFCEFFAGIGLVRDGLAASGWSCLYANDIDAKKQELYEGRFGSNGHFIWATYGTPMR